MTDSDEFRNLLSGLAPGDLELLTPDERTELDRLLAPPTFEQILASIPITVKRQLLVAIRTHKAETGHDSASIRELARYLPADVHRHLADAFGIGYWRGPADFEPLPSPANWPPATESPPPTPEPAPEPTEKPKAKPRALPAVATGAPRPAGPIFGISERCWQRI